MGAPPLPHATVGKGGQVQCKKGERKLNNGRGLQWALGCAGNRQRHAGADAQPAGRQDAGRRLDTGDGHPDVPASGWPSACAVPCRCTPVAVQRQVAGLEAGGHPGLDLVHLVKAGAAGMDAARVAIMSVLHSRRGGKGMVLQVSSMGADESAAASCDEQPQQPAACCQAERAPQHSTARHGTVGSGPPVGGQPWYALVPPTTAQRTCSAYSPDRRRPPLLSNTRNQA